MVFDALSIIFYFKGGKFIKQVKKENQSLDLVNENIPDGDIRLIDENGNNRGILSKEKAIAYAESVDLDVVVVNDTKPYTAKVMDYAKYRFDQQKRLKEMKKNQQVIQVKEVRLGPTIQDNDFNTKLVNAKKFLEKGDKVRISMFFKGRMINNIEVGLNIFKKFLSSLEEFGTIEQKLTQERNIIFAIVGPSKKKK